MTRYEFEPKTEPRYELAVEWDGSWELIGEYESEEVAKYVAREYATDFEEETGVMNFGISSDPESGHYEVQYRVEAETGKPVKRDLANILMKVNWSEVHHARVSDQHRVELWLGGDDTVSIVPMGHGEYQPGVTCIASYRCWSLGAMDTDYYAAGWTEYDRDEGTYRMLGTDEVLAEDEMVHRCIDEGEWGHDYESWIAEAIEAAKANAEERKLWNL